MTRNQFWLRPVIVGVLSSFFMSAGMIACSVLSSPEAQTAADTAAAVCDAAETLGLLASPAFRASAQARGLDPVAVAALACQVPAIVQAFRDAQQARAADPGEAVVVEMAARGLL
jgi:hypothetical protein